MFYFCNWQIYHIQRVFDGYILTKKNFFCSNPVWQFYFDQLGYLLYVCQFHLDQFFYSKLGNFIPIGFFIWNLVILPRSNLFISWFFEFSGILVFSLVCTMLFLSMIVSQTEDEMTERSFSFSVHSHISLLKEIKNYLKWKANIEFDW